MDSEDGKGSGENTKGEERRDDQYDGSGGGILNFGTLTLSGCNVTGNKSVTGGAYLEGGGIANHGTMTLIGCKVTGNAIYTSFVSYGGGVYNDGTMTLNGCNVAGNSIYAQGSSYNDGGGVYIDGTMTLSGCNVTGNSAGLAGTDFSKGGGIFNDTKGNLTILSSTVLNNTASDGADICSIGSMTISKDSSIGSKVSRR